MSAQKTPLSRTLATYVNRQVVKHLSKLGLSPPGTVAAIDASGTIVTVNFQVLGLTLPQVMMPLAGPEYIRYPIQVGCKGFAVSAGFYLGAMSGLGGGTASDTPQGNLSKLVFVPFGNKGNSATDDANAVVIYGPNGVILRDTNSDTVVTLTPTGVDVNAQDNVTVEAGSKVQVTVGSNNVLINSTGITLTVGGATFAMTATGIVSSVPITAPAVTATGALVGSTATIGGKAFATHTHNVTVASTPSTVTSTGPN